ncbi:HAD superfamily hydrolase (TIGR01509 family) [Clostridiales Family XIII bacterium PM5-7]
MIKGAIFDVDGTLLDTMHLWHDSGARYLQSIGITAEPGLGDKLFAMTVDMGAHYLIREYDLQLPHEEVKRSINAIVETPYIETATFRPGGLELLKAMKAENIPMTVATSTGKPFITGVFQRLGIMDYFEELFTCPEMGVSKSDPFIFHEAAKAMGTKPEETWLFEDGLYSIKTAKAAGFKVVGIYDEVSKADQEEIKALSDIYVRELTEFDIGGAK